MDDRQEEMYQDGYACYVLGFQEADCPYSGNDGDSWQEGYAASKDELHWAGFKEML